MLSTLFGSILTSTATSISPVTFMICILVSLGIGLFLAAIYRYKEKPSRSFLLTLAILPAVVCVVIMMVNGNVGTGVAVAGAFSLVRFRSVPGKAKEIVMIFLTMGAGLITGMGYLGYAVLFAVVMGIILVIWNTFAGKREICEKQLRITVPEDLDFDGMFEDIFEAYTSSCETVMVKTTNMGSLYKLKYNVVLKDAAKAKEMIDALRCRNGNLEISLSNPEVNINDL